MRPNRSVKNDDGVMVDFIFGPAFICDCGAKIWTVFPTSRSIATARCSAIPNTLRG